MRSYLCKVRQGKRTYTFSVIAASWYDAFTRVVEDFGIPNTLSIKPN